MHHSAVSPEASNQSSAGSVVSGVLPRQGSQDGRLQKLKEAVSAQIGSQLQARPKSKLGQAEALPASPPEIKNGSVVAGASRSESGALRITSITHPYKKIMPGSANSKHKFDSYEGTITASYPFPQMPTPRGIGQVMSPGPHDRALPSGSATPSSFAFAPAGTNPTTPFENPDFPTPNMYELALRLHSEPGMDAFWSNLVKICITFYKAERLSLTVPTDSTDLENTPWGQKATYRMEDNDGLSLTYLGDGGVGDIEPEETEVEEESDEQSGVPILEGPIGEGSQTEEQTIGESSEDYSSMDEQPLPIEGNPDEPFSPIVIGVDQDDHESSNSDWVSDGEAVSPMDSPLSQSGPAVNGLRAIIDEEDQLKGRVYSRLQPLSYEADALLDSAGVIRVLQRGKTVVLSREYRDVQSQYQRPVSDKTGKENPRQTPWSSSHCQSIHGTRGKRTDMHISLEDLPPPAPAHPLSEPPTPLPFISRVARRKGKRQRQSNIVPAVEQFYSAKQHQMHHSSSHSPSHSLYEEYEQALSSPWSQSPAPSPAIKADPSENPFFTRMDEDCFNPTGSSPNYSAQEPVHAIGLESASTVIHIPLIHPSISRLFRTHNKSSCEPYAKNLPIGTINRSTSAEKRTTNGAIQFSGCSESKAPIAILSILSPVIPYPSNLVHSLSHLAPLVATAFALAQAHDNLQTQLLNAKERRMLVAYPLRSNSSLSLGRSSATSPSSNSTYSRFSSTSHTASPNTELGLLQGRGVIESPALGVTSEYATASKASADSYFTEKHRLLARDVVPSTSTPQGWYINEIQYNNAGGSERKIRHERSESSSSGTTVREKTIDSGDEGGKSPTAHDLTLQKLPPKISDTDHVLEESGSMEDSIFGVKTESLEGSRGPIRGSGLVRRGYGERLRPLQKGKPQYRRNSAVLPSYGADYAATFNVLAEHGVLQSHNTNTTRSHFQVPQLSPRLLKLIIDGIPVHVFIAAPLTGDTLWVNKRLLSYHGNTAEEYFRDPLAPLHPEDRGEYRRLWRRAVESGVQFSHSLRVANFEGEYRWFMTRAVPLRDGKGGIVYWFGINMDVHDQRVAEINAARQQEMAESEHKYRSLANSSPQIVFACTANEGITFANTQWEEYSGQTLEQTLKLGFMEFVHPQDRKKCSLPGLNNFKGKKSDEVASMGTEYQMSPEVRSPGSRSRERGKYSARPFEVPEEDGSDGTFSTELRLQRKDNEYRWHLVRCLRVESNFGTGEGQWFGTCTDINDHKLLEQKLKEANDAAQKTMESKTRFLANMSHEIRTPLIGISGMVNFLLDTTLSGEQLDYCHTISQSSEGLLMVINDILDLSKVEAGMMRLNNSWFRIHSLIEDANELLSTMAIQKQLELNYVVDEDVPLVVGGDRVRLRQVLLNVIGNAIKFTNIGEVYSRCSVVKDSSASGDKIMLLFECHDTGPGFDKQEEELIFKPFSQIDGSSTRAHGGSGLGLVISRQLVELHGGTMTARSEKGKGSTFFFTATFGLPSGGSGAEAGDIDDHILDKGFTGNPSSITGDSDDSDSDEDNNFSDFISPSQKIHGNHPLGIPQGEYQSLWSSHPPDIQEKVSTYTPAVEGGGSVSASPAKGGLPDSTKSTPPEFSILIVSQLPWSLYSITHHIRMTLPKTVPHHLELASSYAECLERLSMERPIQLTHIVLNMPDQAEVIALLRHIRLSKVHASTSLLVLTNPVQRAAIIEGAAKQYEEMGEGNRIQIINKPLKPSRFGSIFDPDKERDASTDRNRDSAQQVVETQKRVFTEMEKDVGNKGHRVLLVEDNPVNQKVLLRFLSRVGLEVETATDGEECVSKVFSNGSGHYALILCDLHMPRKDGFQACAEIRQWEKARKLPLVPIIALSANVMSDVAGKCAAAGFSNYVAKPVDFEVLSSAIKELLDPMRTHLLMSQRIKKPDDLGVDAALTSVST